MHSSLFDMNASLWIRQKEINAGLNMRDSILSFADC